ncbi:MAG: carbonic anhydrase [Hyphomicrobiales bacterium]|jgi:carbonic anhydrase
MVERLLARNVAWSIKRNEQDPGYFARLAEQQAPDYFWIGCSDSRVPANVVAGLDPGEVFVHRNVANVVHSSDMNLLSALEYAIEALQVRQVIVCGHYGCGGVKAATESLPHGLADHWLEPIRRLARAYAVDLAHAQTNEEKQNKLAELNVIEGVLRVSETPIVQRAWQRGQPVAIHGLIYGLSDGRLRNLNCTVSAGHLDREPSPTDPRVHLPKGNSA